MLGLLIAVIILGAIVTLVYMLPLVEPFKTIVIVIAILIGIIFLVSLLGGGGLCGSGLHLGALR